VLRITEPKSVPSQQHAAPAKQQASPARPNAAAPPTNKPSRVPRRIQPHNPKPVTLDTRKLIGRAYQLGQSAKSEADYTQVLTLCRQASAATSDEEVTAYLNRLMSWAHNRRGQEISEQAKNLAASGEDAQARSFETRALDDYDRAVQLDPTRWRAVHNRAVSYALSGEENYELALRDLNRTIELQPQFFKAWLNRAGIRCQLGQYDQALDDYAQALRLKPDDVLALRGRGDTYRRAGQLQRALTDFTRIVELAPGDASVRTDRAELYAQMGLWKEAADGYQKALQLDTDFGRAYLGVAWLMSTCPDERFRNPKLAVPAAEKAIELDGPRDHRYLDTLAAAYASAGMFDEAKEAAQRALEMAPQGRRTAVKNRLALYARERPYRQSFNPVRPAGGIEP
jgi:tetratricopeptide (TPR) repeat protein